MKACGDGNQLGISTLRPGPSGNETAPNHANYDESLANFSEVVESLTGGEYYWMAGNYMKYGASASKWGDMGL